MGAGCAIHPLLSGGGSAAKLEGMAERGTLRLDTGDEVRVEVVKKNRDGDEIVVRATSDESMTPKADLLAIIDAHLETATSHRAGTTDRLLAVDRGQSY